MRIVKTVISAFFPKTCACCGDIIDEDERICDFCREIIVRCDPLKRCPKCGMNEENCNCKYHIYHFSSCVAPFVNTGSAKQAMYSFKFGGKIANADFIAENMALVIKNEYRDICFDALVFVPMPRLKKLKRGFNQSEVLARKLAGIFNLPLYKDALYCANANLRVSQHKLKQVNRFENVRGLYASKYRFRGETVLLVDDIETTGATLDECARQLLLSGCKQIYCVTGLVTEKAKLK